MRTKLCILSMTVFMAISNQAKAATATMMVDELVPNAENIEQVSKDMQHLGLVQIKKVTEVCLLLFSLMVDTVFMDLHPRLVVKSANFTIKDSISFTRKATLTPNYVKCVP